MAHHITSHSTSHHITSHITSHHITSHITSLSTPHHININLASLSTSHHINITSLSTSHHINITSHHLPHHFTSLFTSLPSCLHGEASIQNASVGLVSCDGGCGATHFLWAEMDINLPTAKRGLVKAHSRFLINF